jgi:hypothetical protein
VWIASYPKSGSTWLRALLANLERGRTAPAAIDRLGATIASSRGWFDGATGVEAAELTHAEVDVLRPRVYERSAASGDDGGPRFHKIHDAFGRPSDGEPLIPVGATRGALYLVRDPRDVCASYAHHSSWDLDTTIGRMADEQHAFGHQTDRLSNQLRQRLSSWSGHVRSWLDNGRVPVHVVRYEDLRAKPAETTAAALSFAGLDRERGAIERAVDWSRFERLRAQELEQGFTEKPAATRPFFRHGAAGRWREELTPGQAARIVRDHEAVMRRLGYLEEAGA